MSVATNTMDAIKKKMQAMKLEKENAFDKADQLEQKLNEQKTVFEKVCTRVCAVRVADAEGARPLQLKNYAGDERVSLSRSLVVSQIAIY